jgi:hypothetical protein
MKEERIAPAGEAPDHGRPLPSMPGAARRARPGPAPPEMDSGGGGYTKALPEAARGAADRATEAAGPPLRIRLAMADPASAPGSVREAVIRCGGSITSDRTARPTTIMARIPVTRMNELLGLLARLGTVVERPPARGGAGMVDLEISW